MHPLIGGIVKAQSVNNFDNDEDDATSHFGATRLTPRFCSSDISSEAALEDKPDLDGKIRCLAPLSAIHVHTARPRPPRPPAIR